jgi:hypothetical protein
MLCAICEIRKPRRFCPGVSGEICSICCGTEREVTVSCPLDCQYLQEARRREKAAPVEESAIPNRDIEVTERLVEENVPLLDTLGSALILTALEIGALDADAREALAALVRTYRTLESGVYYDTRPTGSFAAALYEAVQHASREFRSEEQRRLGVTRTRDADVLGLIVFLQRIELDRNNEKPRGRAFIDSLRAYYSTRASALPPSPSSSLLLP